MTRPKSKLEKAQEMASLAARKASKKMKELNKQTREELQPKVESTFKKTQKTAGVAFKKTSEKIEELGEQTNEVLEERKERKAESKNKLEQAQATAECAVQETNEKMEKLGTQANELFEVLTTIQVIFDLIRNVPSDKELELAELKTVRLNWKNQVNQIEKDYQMAVTKGAGVGALGTGAGVAVAALGPAVAMGIATSFGVASTGTAISALSGAAATNAALAWLGGGALAAGGGGMVVGNLLLALTGPVGWGVAGVAILSGGSLFLRAQNEKEQLENIFTLISLRDTKSYNLAIVELNERTTRIKRETKILQDAVQEFRDFGLDYEKMSNQQQYELGTYVNFMHSSTQLLVNPILGLQPKYSEKDYLDFLASNQHQMTQAEKVQFEKMIIFLANLLYKIDLSEKDQTIIWKAIRSNEELLESMNLAKGEFNASLMDQVEQALTHKYQMSEY